MASSALRLVGPLRSRPSDETGSGRGTARRPRLRDSLRPFDTFVVVPSVAALVWLLGRLDLMAATPYAVTAALLWVAHVVGSGSTFWSDLRPHDRLVFQLRLAAQFAASTAFLYSTGWGPMLAMGYLLIVQEAMRSKGSATWRAGAFWGVVSLAFGHLAVATGVAPSMVATPAVHGIAGLSALALVFVCRLMGEAARQQELAKDEIAGRERRFRSLVQNSYDAVTVLDIEGTITSVTPAIERILGYTPEEILGTPAFDLVHLDDLPRTAALFDQLLAGPGQLVTAEIRAVGRNGDARWVECAATNLLGDADLGAIVVNWRDVTERKELAERLQFEASHDPLTGLANRAAFTAALERSVARNARTGGGMAVLFLDLDDFKLVNDSLGHEGGDALLAEVARRLEQVVRPGDVVGRLGGDEFTILLEDIERPEDAVAVAERALAGASPISFSVGIAVGDGGTQGGDLLREADLAMYVAKRRGRSCWELFDGHPTARETGG